MRSCGYQLFLARIDYCAESFESSRTQEIQIVGMGEYNFVYGFETINLQKGIANIANDDFAICHCELLTRLFDTYSDPYQNIFGQPCEFGTGIDNQFGDI